MNKKTTIIIVSFCLSWGSAYSQNAPSFCEDTFTIPHMFSPQVVFIPEMADNDGNTQEITITSAVSEHDSIIRVDSFAYDNQYNMGILYIMANQAFGKSDITVEIEDGGPATNTFSGKITVFISDFFSDQYKGVYYEHYDICWQPGPCNPMPGTLRVIDSTYSPDAFIAKDFFWQVMNGYIRPSVSGYYSFVFEGNEGGFLYLNMEDGFSDVIYEMPKYEDAGWQDTAKTDTFYLEANHPYYFEAQGKDVVNDQEMFVKWSGPDIHEKIIKKEHLLLGYDTIVPEKPDSIYFTRVGDSSLFICWPNCYDNNSTKGYNVFVDGKLFKQHHPDTFLNIENLLPETRYSIAVEAVDSFNNRSGFNDLFNISTYATDEIAPGIPQNLSQGIITCDAVELFWDEVIDNESETWGYNIFVEGVKVNNFPVHGTRFVYGGLSPESTFSIKVTAVDGGLNESAKSDELVVTTPKFNPEENLISNNHKARVHVSLDAIDRFPGLGLHINHKNAELMTSNCIKFGHFEDPGFKNLTLTEMDKDTIGAVFSLTQDTGMTYKGNHSAMVYGISGDVFRSWVRSDIRNDHTTYRIEFAAKNFNGYSGQLNVSLHAEGVAEKFDTTISLSNNWKVYSFDNINIGFDGGIKPWNLDFMLTGDGFILLDDLAFYDEATYDGSKFNKKTLAVLKEFNASGYRRGGINSNGESFNESSGPHVTATLTMADMMYLSNNYGGGYTFLNTGMNTTTDWHQYDSVYLTFLEYLAGDSTTTGGKIRIQEGYDDLITNANGLVIELGNEVWGFDVYQDAIDNYTDYSSWARSKNALLRSSPLFDDEKMMISYSGRSPDIHYGLHRELFIGDTGSLDVLALSGYMGGNLNYDLDRNKENIPCYYKNYFEYISNKFEGLEQTFFENIEYTGKAFPSYLYEGNLTVYNFYGRLGQAIMFSDYYTGALRGRVSQAVVYQLHGGQWSLLQNLLDYKKNPLFYTGALLNNKCKGINLGTQVETKRTISSCNGRKIDLDPLGAYAFYTPENTENYALALFSRDYQHDYKLQLNLPDTLQVDTIAFVHTITGNYMDAIDIVYSTDTITNFSDSFLIDLPKYSMKVITFSGDGQDFGEVPLVNLGYKNATSVKIYPQDSLEAKIDEDDGMLVLERFIEPVDADFKTVKWSMEPNYVAVQIGDYLNNSLIVKAGGNGSICNGTITIRASLIDNPEIYDEIDIEITNQKGPTCCILPPNEIIHENAEETIEIFPNPAKDELFIRLENIQNNNIEVYNTQGNLQINKKIYAPELKLDVSILPPGVYLIKIGNTHKKFIKNLCHVMPGMTDRMNLFVFFQGKKCKHSSVL